MRFVNYFLCSVFLLSSVFAADANLSFYHYAPEGVIRGDEVKIEVMLTGASSEIYDMHLFYREVGDLDYKMTRMTREGLLYFATLRTAQFSAGQMQYYIGYEGALGEIGTLPEEMPQLNPLVMQIAPARSIQEDSPVELVILSPLPDETLVEEDIVVAVSIFPGEEEIDYSTSKLIIDGVEIESGVDFSEGLMTYSPPPGHEFRAGNHNIDLQVYSAQGKEIAQKGWSFRSTKSAATNDNVAFRGSVFLEDRYQNISKTDDNYFRTGGEFSGKYNALDYRARLVISSEEGSDRQPVNRFTGNLRYNFSEDNNIFLRGGDINPYFNPLVLQDKRIRGIHTGLAYGFFTFDYVMGQMNRGIEGTMEIYSSGQGITDTISVGGTYSQDMWAMRPGFRFGDNVQWSLNLINAKDDPKSIKIGSNARESLSLGTDLNMNFDRKRIMLDVSVNASVNNSNAGLEEVSWDTLTNYNEDLKDNSAAESAWNFLDNTGWLSLTTGLNPLPSLAMQFDATFRYFYNNLKIRYYKLDKDFASPGNPYILKDISGLNISDNIRLFENQVYLTLFYKNYTTNQSLEKEATANNELGVTLSYFPYATLPSVTVSYATLGRSNDVSPSDSMLIREDNSTQRLSFNTSYNMHVSGIKNTISLNYTTYGRDEEINPAAQSDFNLYGIGLRTYFGIPLVSRINYSKSENEIGTVAANNKSTSSVSTLLIGLDYILDGVLGGDIFKPFFNYRLQQVETTSPTSTFETGRNNFTIGLAYQSPAMGVLSIRYDHITYDNELIDFNDSVMNARYSYNF